MKQSNFVKLYKKQAFLNPYDHPLNEFPFYIDVELTNVCNLKCIMCSRRIMTRKLGYMDWDTYKRIIDETSQYDAGVRLVMYGEPFLNKEIIDMSKYARNKNVLLFISTNGLLLSEDVCRKIVAAGIDEVRFSMQGTDRVGYDKMRVNGDYDLFVKNVRLLLQVRNALGSEVPFISLSTSVTKETKKAKDDFKMFWSDIVDSLNIDVTSFVYVEHLDEVKEYLDDELVDRTHKPCIGVMTKLAVTWNGDITACCSDYDGKLVIGNIRNISIKEAWESGKLNGIREVVGKACNHERIAMCSKCYQVTTKFDNLKKDLL